MIYGKWPLSLCYYHRRYEKEAAKCKTGTNGNQCEFQKLSRNRSQSEPDEKQISDLRNKITPDLRNSLKKDLRVHLKNQGARSKAKRLKQDPKSHLSRSRAHKDNVVEEDLFERRGNKHDPGSKAIVDHKHGHGKLIHVSEVQEEAEVQEEEDPTDSQEVLVKKGGYFKVFENRLQLLIE